MRLLALLAASLAIAPLASGGGPVVSSHGVEVVVLPGWRWVQPASAGPVTDPRTLLVVGTAGVRPEASRCQIAAYRLPPTAAAVVVVGWKRLALSGAQGERPGRWPLDMLTRVRRPSFECFEGRGASQRSCSAGRRTS